MRKNLAILFLAFAAFVSGAAAQQKLQPTNGEVAAMNAAANQLTIKTKDGEAVVALDAKTDFKRIAPDKLSEPASAVVSSLAEITIGDKLVVVGVVSEDKKSISQTRRVFLLKQADITKQQQAETEKWTTRGVSGKVTAVNAANGELTVAMRGMGGDKAVVVATGEKTMFKRYAPNSVKYSEAKASNLTEIKVGDQLRARGEKTSDGGRLTAEEVLSGSFKMVAGKIESIDAAKGEVTIRDVQTNKPVTIVVGEATLLRRFKPETAQLLAMRAGGQTPPGMAGMGGGRNGQGGQRPQNQTPPSTGGQMPPQQGTGGGMGQGGGMMRGGGDVDSMIDRLPVLTLAELKVGDAVAASSSQGATPDRVTAIKFVAGVEPFLTAPQIPSGGQGGGRPQSSPSFSIPGLDGIGAP